MSNTEPFLKVPHSLIDNEVLTSVEKCLYMLLTRLRTAKRGCVPSYAYLKQKLKIKEERTIEQNLDIPKVHGFKKISQPRKQKQQQIVQIKNKQCSGKTRNNPTTQQSKSHEPGPLTRRHYQLNWLLHQCMPSYYVDEYHDVFYYCVEIFINHLNGAFSGAHQWLECHRH